VPPSYRTKLIEVMKGYGGLAAEVEDFSTTTGSPIEYPTLDDTANQGNLTGESESFTGGSDIAFGQVPLGAYKYTAGGADDLPIRVSVELLQDAAFDVVSLITRLMGTRIARKQAAHWCTGTGVEQPKGIVSVSLTADETLDVSDTIDYDDILDTEGALDPEYEQNAKWAMNKASWTQIRAIVGTDGRPLVQPAAQAGIGGKPEKVLLGYPVVIDQGMPNLVDTGAYFAVLGVLREAYIIRRVSQLAIVVNPYSRASYGQVEYTGWQRADGNIQNRSAYKILRNV
jgi:HK97 family phage major capsid protein